MVGHFFLANPISAHGNQMMDQSYRYGESQNNKRETHHGVEYPNKQGMPVLAVYPGEVIFAGSDDNQKVAWVTNFYGNVIVLRHQVDGIRLPVYSLYGHLKDFTVTKGQTIDRGKMIGTVGATGTAMGSHLHFEVRIGYNNYAAVQNPALWITPGDGYGVLSGVVKQGEKRVKTAPMNIQRVIGGVPVTFPYTSVETYDMGKLPVASDIYLEENFAVGDLPTGDYRISLVFGGRIYEQYFRIDASKLTYIVFDVD